MRSSIARQPTHNRPARVARWAGFALLILAGWARGQDGPLADDMKPRVEQLEKEVRELKTQLDKQTVAKGAESNEERKVTQLKKTRLALKNALQT